MDNVRLKAYAKINLAIDLLGKRKDEYNEVKMIMQTIDIFDEIYLTKIDEGIIIECDNYEIPQDGSNTAYKAAQIMIDTFNINSGLKINIIKNIPIAAGLGGGSADAAAVIEGINTMFNLNLDLHTMLKIGEKIGADVPYCIYKNTVLATGKGEKLTRIANFDSMNIVVIKPDFGVSTKEVYNGFDYSIPKKRPDFKILIGAIENKEIEQVACNMVNVLELVTEKKNPIIGDIKSELLENGALGAMMSGSGPTVFALFRDEKTAKNAYNILKDRYTCYLTRTVCF